MGGEIASHLKLALVPRLPPRLYANERYLSPYVSVKLLHRAIPLKNLRSSHLSLAPTNKEMISRPRAQIFNIYLVGWLVDIFLLYVAVVVIILRKDFPVQLCLSWNLFCRPSWLQDPRAGIKSL